MPGHAGNIAHLLTGDLFDRCRDSDRNKRQNLFLRNEAGFGVELHELELAIGTKIFVAKTTSDLVVTIDAANHAQLLEQLRALRKRVKRSGRQTAGHDKVTRAFWSRCDQHRGFDFDETLIVHGPSKRGIYLGADTEVALHPFSAQIDITVREANHFVDLDTIVELERWRLRDIQNLNAAIANFDLASGHVRVGRAIGALTNDSSNANYVFRTKVSGTIDHALHESGVITKIDKGQMLTVLTAAGYPPAHRDLAANVGDSQRSAMVGTHGNRISHRRSFGFRRVEQREQWQRSSERQLLVRCRRADHGSLRCRPRLRRHR
ncbi:unannotated protein [freshwater metagenome]|uniref:Unannotated protein n=1 Tax=freshwater metagenome TaxID=449393 RepID=A0A6J6S0Q1_9ZZZZ